VGIAVARCVGGEVVSCDALAVYRGLSVLTAKPSPPADVPHHVVDVAAPEESFSAARFAQAADAAVASIRARGRVPLLVGGTALYLKAWVKGLGAGVGRDPALRERLRSVARASGPRALHERLRALDPARAEEIHENDERRLVRALEIIEATGRPASALRKEWRGPDRVAVAVVGLRREPQDLRERIEARARALPEAGVLEEVARFRREHPDASPEVRKTLGLAEIVEHLDGRLSLADALDRIALATRRFARRQATFFRQFEDATWIDVGRDATPESVAAPVIEAFARAGAL
jgi:tRNA dimethylallyltransferase